MYKLKMDNAMNTLRPHFLPILKLKGDTQTRRIYRLLYSIFTVWLFLLVMEGGVSAQNMDPIYYDTGSPILKDIWIDYLHGNDSNTGDSRSSPLKTPDAAWRRIPQGAPLTGTGYRILLASGDYPASSLPNYMESRYGTFDFPIIIGAADGPMTAQIHGYLNIYDTRYLYLVNLSLVTDPGYGGGGNVIHIEHGDHILMKGCRLDGFDGSINQPQETLKMNQCQYIYIEDCDISGAFWFAFDFVAVEYGHIVGNRIHNAEDDCLVLKGGAACFRIENNEVYNCGTVGLTAGQGTGLEYMVNPWLHYEAYDLKFFNNLVHDVSNAGLAIRGGYNILMAYNTLYRIGNSSQGAGLILASPGARSCDGDTGACRLRHDAGGWGPTSGEGGDWIPNRNIYVYNNIFYNPAPFQTRWSHFTIFGPVYPPASSNVPSPALSDKNLQFRGNIVWNGPSDHPLGIEDATYNPGCQSDNPTCNESQLRSENEINTLEPQLINPAIGDFRPRLGGNVFTATSYPVPKFNGGDRAQPPLAPEGNLQNTMNRDFAGNPRTVSDPPGAFVGASSACSLSCTASASQNNGSAPLVINFTGKAMPSNCTETPAFEWDFGDGTTHSILQNPSHTYKKTGVFTWTMDVSLNGARCIQKGTITVSGQTTTTTVTSSTTTISSTTTTTVPSGPSAPSYLRAKALSPLSIILAWRDNSNNETGFKIERTTGNCGSSNAWSEIGTVGTNGATYTDTNLLPNTAYSYRTRSYNTTGNSNYTSCISEKTGIFGTPHSPTNLNAVSISNSSIHLTWHDNSTNETQFRIFRRTGDGYWILLATKGANVTNHSDSTASGNKATTNYRYYVTACNNAGCSPISPIASVPLTPTNLNATVVGTNQIRLSWTDTNTNETGFEIMRKNGNCASANPWNIVKRVGANITSWNNTGVGSGATYSYRVRAYSQSYLQPYSYGYSSWSACAQATTP